MAIPTLAMIPSGYKAGKLYSVLPSDGTGDFTVARNSVATRVNQSGLIEEVGVNVPRLDYSAGGCPVLLTEIASQNIIPYSEDFSNAAWGKIGLASITSNLVISPNGNQDASLLVSGNATSAQGIQESLSFVNGNDYVVSIFAKKKDYNFLRINFGGFNSVFNGNSVWFDLENGVLGTIQTGIEARIDYFGNGWYRCIAIQSATATATGKVNYFLGTSDNDNNTIGDGFKGNYIWGAQVEAQPAATSYIKSNTGSVTTREADLVNGAGSAATFNSLEHTFFVDLNSAFQSGANSDISIVGSTGTVTDNRILIRKQNNNTSVEFSIRSGASNVATETLSNIDFSIKQKLAVTVKLNEVKYYRNGFLVATDTGTIPLPVSLGELTLTSGTTGFHKLAASTKDIRYYNEVLTAAETLELMSYDSFNEMASALQYTIK